MGFFKKNPNEVAFHEGKKHWVDVIKNTGPSGALLWRQPEEDFNNNSTLIVMPGEEAIFVKGGTIVQTFENGTYKLSTQNYPFISRLRNQSTGGISVFNCVVYFFRRADTKEMRWGTDTPLQVRDKVYGIRTSVRARGSYKLRIEDPGMFLEKLIGSNEVMAFQQDMYNYFHTEFLRKIKSALSTHLNELNRELIGIEDCLDDVSEKLQPVIDATVSEYGLRCVTFSVVGMTVDTSKYDELDRSQMDSIAVMRQSQAAAAAKANLAQGDRAAMDIIGDDWGKQQSANILKDLVNNPGAGGIAAAGAGLGMGVASAGIFSTMAQQLVTPLANSPAQQAAASPASTAPVAAPSGRFVQNNAPVQQPAPAVEPTPAPAAAPAEDPVVVLGKLKKLLDAGLIEQEEYNAKKLEILSRM